MSIEVLFDHVCDIFHMVRSDNSPGFGLPASPSFNYEATPDVENVSCHFGVKNGTETIVQGLPANDYSGRIKLSLPIGTDIRFNDKVVNVGNGFEYTADIPKNIRNHHLTVMLRRTSTQEAL